MLTSVRILQQTSQASKEDKLNTITGCWKHRNYKLIITYAKLCMKGKLFSFHPHLGESRKICFYIV